MYLNRTMPAVKCSGRSERCLFSDRMQPCGGAGVSSLWKHSTFIVTFSFFVHFFVHFFCSRFFDHF